MSQRRLLVLGDSVTWGQGLLDVHKPGTLVGAALARAGRQLELRMLAHSGATIGVVARPDQAAIDGEVPVSYPTILRQVEDYADPPGEVAVIILNGGINDVDIRRILNPLTPVRDLSDAIERYCRHDMATLLDAVVAKFDDPATKIVVTAYYPILSPDSDPFRIKSLLDLHAISPPFFVPTLPVLDTVVDHCLQFWGESTAALQGAVSQSSSRAGGDRIRLAVPAFTVRNAVFATDPRLFGLDGAFGPQDEVAGARHQACDVSVPAVDVLGREQCYRASAGHPNVHGAQQFADAILQALHGH